MRSCPRCWRQTPTSRHGDAQFSRDPPHRLKHQGVAMPSLPSASTGGRAVPLCLASLLPLSLLLLLCLGCSGAGGASLREHRLRGSESDPQWVDAHRAPNADMVKALEYIQGLRQQQQQAAPGGRAGDGERLRAMMRLASAPARGKEQEEVEEEEEEGDGREDKSEELLQAVLSTLQQTEKASKAALPRPSSMGGGGEKQQAITPHKKLPLMFEDEDEEGEGDEEEEEEEEGEDGEEGARDSPFKRTNENVEEKYTPQNLATLQSVFDELDKLTGGTAAHKRRDEGDAAADEEEEEEDGEDLLSLRSAAPYDELADWGAPRDREDEDEEEEEEEEEDGKFDRGLDYAYDEDADENEESYLAKRSEDPDDVTNLVDYYLLKVLERTEEEEQKRALEEEEEEEEEEQQQRAERRAAQYGEGVDPRAIYRLIQISQKYQIPPEDLLDMMRGGEPAGRKPSPVSAKKTHGPPDAYGFYGRRLPERQKDPRTQEILDILGLGEGQQAPPPRRQHKSTPLWLRAAPPPAAAAAPAPRHLPPARPKDYDDTVDEDELAAYLAAQMLAQYPGGGRGRAGQKREEAGPRAGPGAAGGSFEQAVQDYLDQMDSDKDPRRRTGEEERGGAAPGRALDGQALMKLLSYMKPETDQSDAKTARGI